MNCCNSFMTSTSWHDYQSWLLKLCVSRLYFCVRRYFNKEVKTLQIPKTIGNDPKRLATYRFEHELCQRLHTADNLKNKAFRISHNINLNKAHLESFMLKEKVFKKFWNKSKFIRKNALQHKYHLSVLSADLDKCYKSHRIVISQCPSPRISPPCVITTESQSRQVAKKRR